MSRLAVFLAVAFALSITEPSAQSAHPNIVVFLVDDMGWADLSVTGHPTIRTPNLDRMASEGIRFTSFYAAPRCTPARGMFLTCRYPVRSGLLMPTGPAHASGLKAGEVTLPEALKAAGYRTAMFGKWHLGDFDTEPYGDVIEELDWSVGQVLAELKARNLDRNTVTVFMSDNGPWLRVAEQLYDRGERGVKALGEAAGRAGSGALQSKRRSSRAP